MKASGATDAGGRGVRVRGGVEWLLHVAAVAIVVWAWWRSAHPTPAGGAEVVDQSELRAALARWTMQDSARAVHVRFDAVPDAVERQWLSALALTGSRVTWDAARAGALPATAVSVEPVATPRGHVRVGVSAPAGATVVVADQLGVIGSTPAPRGVVTMRTATPVGTVRARVGETVASAGRADSLALKRIYVVGSAGWEGKFVVRALEEEGWSVDARFVVAPKNDVVPDKPVELDTAHYAAVVALDSAVAGDRTRIAAYVTSGGGLVLAPGAVPAVASVAAGGAGAVVRGAPVLVDSMPKRGLELRPVERLATGAVALERRDAVTTVAARRVGNGRVVQVGYTDSWRWRMAAGDSGAASHRAWWAGLVAAVAYAPVIARAATSVTDPAPMAATVERLGAPLASAPAAAARHLAVRTWWVFASLVCALVAEWASRRIRGAR